MFLSYLNLNIYGVSPTTFVGVAAFGAFSITAATVATVGFGRRINSSLNYGRSGLGLYLGQNLRNSFLRYCPRRNRYRGKWGNLHGKLPAGSSDQRSRILASLYKKSINHFVLKYSVGKLLIFNNFGLVQGNMKRLSRCTQAKTR